MKKFLMMLAFAGFVGTANAQTSAANATDLKQHACTASCSKEAHAYLHGEKDHTCTEACTSAVSKDMKAAGCCAGKKQGASCAKGAKADGHADAHSDAHATMEHACTTACADGKHTYACGEKGHECSTACTHAH